MKRVAGGHEAGEKQRELESSEPDRVERLLDDQLDFQLGTVQFVGGHGADLAVMPGNLAVFTTNTKPDGIFGDEVRLVG